MVQSLVNAAGATLTDDDVQAFTASFKGVVLTPSDAGYDDARKCFNGMIDRKPGLIARPRTDSDVQAAVNFAREHNLLVSVQGGGHSVQGYGVCEAGLMIDMALMKAIKVDPKTKTSVAEAGVNWGEFDAATQAHGLAVTGGRNPTTGIAGLTLGSGSGWLERKLGYTVDNLLSVDIVTANGDLLHASADENADLFWGVRGGGGNFGVVTRFEYQLHNIGPMVYGGQLAFPRIPQVVKAYRDFMETADENIGGGIALVTAPHEEFVPPPVRGMPVMGIIVCYAGPPENGPEAIAPLLALNPVINLCQEMPYVAVQDMLTASNPPGGRNYWKADMYPELPDEAIDAVMAAAATPLSPMSVVLFQPVGGKVHEVADDATAIGWRSAKWALHVLGHWDDAAEDEKNIEWVRNIASAAKQYAQDGAYLNYLMDEGEERIRASFGSSYDRMVELKRKYDPSNLFRLNQNIKPD